MELSLSYLIWFNQIGAQISSYGLPVVAWASRATSMPIYRYLSESQLQISISNRTRSMKQEARFLVVTCRSTTGYCGRLSIGFTSLLYIRWLSSLFPLGPASRFANWPLRFRNGLVIREARVRCCVYQYDHD